MSNETINGNKTEVEVTQVSNDVLPEVSKSFCFVGEDFANESFSVDLFVKRNRSKASLEQLKDDLSSYLRILKTSMIDLINEDYTDFVNLSTNLMGLDKSIGNLSTPLRQLRDDGLKVEQQFNDVIHELETKITKLNIVRQNKNQLNKIIDIINGIDRAEKWFNDFENSHNINDNEKHWFSSVERIALIITKIEMQFKSLSLNIPLVTQQLSPRFELISNLLYENLESGFFSAITNSDRQQLESILRIYSLNGKHAELENMFRQKVVKPYMNEVICESFLDKYGINRFFQEILEFIDLKCQLIIDINDENFSFMISSVWKEISNCLIVRTPSLFSAGNPDHFHFQYSSTAQFIDNFIAKSKIRKSDLENDANYNELMSKFNIEVYFHIRFQQIATRFESSLVEHPYDYNNENGINKFKLFVTQVLYECVTTCWSPQTVFISHLFSSFWKLTLQLFSRYTFWLQNLKDSEIKFASNNTSLNETTVQNTKYSNQSIFLGLLVNDCENLLTKLKSFFQSNILQLKPFVVDDNELRQSFSEALESVSTNGLSNVIKLIKWCLVNQCDLVLRQVNDVPRLYRKTNKDVPTKASNYVNNCMDLITFITSSETQVWKIEWTQDILREVTSHFKQFTSEVLTSVQKIEDSLKRLKKAKVGNQNNQIKNNSSMSDDDKIRLQIYYDVEEYGKQIEEKLGVKKESIKPFMELYEMAIATKNLIN